MTKILVIEDEALLREEILDLLEIEGFEAVGAEGGQVGVQLAQTQLPDLIICDIMMPELDGYGVLTTLRQNSDTALIPFIFLSAKGTAEDYRQGLRLGADDYLAKPFEQAELLEAIATRLVKQTILLQLHQQVEELKQSNLLRDDFLNTASQELRNPLTNIMMAVRMLKQAPSQERIQRYIEILQSECSRELDLFNNLLDLQRLEMNARPLLLESLSLQEWIPSIVEPFQVRARSRKQSIWMNIPPYIPSVALDCTDLKQILSELLNNACKYTAPGNKIAVEVQRTPTNSGGLENLSSITLVVSNEAEIPAEALPHLFEQFYRVPQGDRWQQNGSGLGLTLVQKLVKRLGGTIQVVSESGWTHFMLQFSIKQPSNPRKEK
jgi:signal transduction histidine kinase